MKRDIGALTAQNFDVVIIGGGSYGACTAWEAASRGLKTALIDMQDFCAATSANHLKMVHGGIRYLQHLDIRRVRQSCAERTSLLSIAPHMVAPIPIIMPTYGRGLEGKAVLGAGLHLYDLVTMDKNRQIREAANKVPRGRIIGREEVEKRVPGIDSKGLTGAGLFFDGQFHNPPRLALAFLRSASERGAVLANYVKAEGFIEEDGRVTGVQATDETSGEQLTIRGRIIINAAGPWAHSLMQDRSHPERIRAPSFSRDAGFIIKGRKFGEVALACKIASKDPDALLSRNGRHIFLVPWRDYTLVGVWHVVHKKTPDDASVSEEELAEFIAEINQSMPALKLTRGDVSMVCSGLTLFGENKVTKGDLRFGHRSLLIDHNEIDGREGLITMVGVRATTARALAESAVDLAGSKLADGCGKSISKSEPLFGADFESFPDLVRNFEAATEDLFSKRICGTLARNYGSDLESIVSIAREEKLADAIDVSDTIEAQVVYAIRSEMAVRLGDVIFRRTEIGSGGNPGNKAIRQCAELMARELHWDESRIREEIELVEASFAKSLAL